MRWLLRPRRRHYWPPLQRGRHHQRPKLNPTEDASSGTTIKSRPLSTASTQRRHEIYIGPPDRQLSVSNVPLTIGGCLPAAAVAEAGTSTPSPFRIWSVVTPVAETIVAVPLVFVPVRVTAIVPMLKLITPVITMPVLIAFVRAFSCSAVVMSHSGLVHREAINLSALPRPYAAAMEATTAARQRARATQQNFG